MSDDIKAGDRFEWLPDTGRTVRVEREIITTLGPRVWECLYLSGALTGVYLNASLEDAEYWRRLPSAPAIGERLTIEEVIACAQDKPAETPTFALMTMAPGGLRGIPLPAKPCTWKSPWGMPCVGWSPDTVFHIHMTEPFLALPQPTTPPKALPFVYLEWCSQKAQHDGKAMCLNCEGLIAEREAGRFVMESKPQRPEPHQPSTSGLGGVCGPVLSKLK